MDIYFDLDGTLIDVSERFYRIYCDLLKKRGCNDFISKNEYWKLKRNRVPEGEIVRKTFDSVDVEDYIKERLVLIESEDYLLYDVPFSFTIDVLRKLKGSGHNLFLVSLRESLSKTKWELGRFGLLDFFDEIMVKNDEDVLDKWRLKVELMNAHGGFDKSSSIFVGDTEADFYTANELGIDCFLVESGIRSRDFLQGISSRNVIRDVRDLDSFF